MVEWFIKFFKVPKSSFVFSVIINEIHKPREAIIRNFWLSLLNINSSQFKKITFVKSKQNKI